MQILKKRDWIRNDEKDLMEKMNCKRDHEKYHKREEWSGKEGAGEEMDENAKGNKNKSDQ